MTTGWLIFFTILSFIIVVRLLWKSRSRDRFISGKFPYGQFIWLAFVIAFTLLGLAGITCILDLKFFESKPLGFLYHFLDSSNIHLEQTKGVYNEREALFGLIFALTGSILMGGLLISTFNNVFERRIEKINNGQISYRFRNHVVIIGFNNMIIGLIKQLSEKEGSKQPSIVILTSMRARAVHHELFSHLDEKIEHKITILSGVRNSEEDLRKLSLHRSQSIYILGEKSEEEHDSLNVECLYKVNKLLKKAFARKFVHSKYKAPKPCHVMFEYQSTFSVFQKQDIQGISETIEFMPFNFHEDWARKVFAEGEYSTHDYGNHTIKYPPIDRIPITAESDKFVHVIISGMTRMGTAMGIEVSQLAHFPNFITKGKKTLVTFIDEHADKEMNFLKGRYNQFFNEIDYSYRDAQTPKVKEKEQEKDKEKEVENTSPKDEKFTDVQWEFIKGSIDHPEIYKMIAELSKSDDRLLTLVVCSDLSPYSIASGLYLPDEVFTNQIPVFIQCTSCAILTLLSQADKYKNVKPFGMHDNCYDISTEDSLPMMVDYAYSVAGEGAVTSFPSSEILKKNWAALNTVLKWSNRYNADMLKIKQRSFDITPCSKLSTPEIELLARVEHNRWIIEKLLMGYRAPNKEEKERLKENREYKDELKKNFVHPDICPYDNLNLDGKGINARMYDIRISEAIPLILRKMNSNLYT